MPVAPGFTTEEVGHINGRTSGSRLAPPTVHHHSAATWGYHVPEYTDKKAAAGVLLPKI